MRVIRAWVVVGLSFAVTSSAAFAQTQQPAPAGAPATTSTGTSTTSAAPAPAPAAAPSPTGAPPPAAGTPGTTGSAPTEGGAYTVRLKSLERNVGDLKEQVFRVKARLNLLKETVLGGVIGASRCLIRHKNEMSGKFQLIRAVYALDGVQIFSKADDTGRLAEMQEFDIYNGAIQPGNHTLAVQLVYQGHGFGVFSYLKNYKFNVRSAHTFTAGDGKATVVTVAGLEKGSVTTAIEDRPAVEFRVNMMTPEGVGAAPAAK